MADDWEKVRQERVEQAVQSGRMEGLELSDDARRLAVSYVSGDIDSTELVEKMRNRYSHE